MTFFTQVAVLCALMLLIAVVEVLVPLQPRRSPKGRVGANLSVSAIVLLLNWLLTMATAMLIIVASLSRKEPDLLLALPGWARIVLTIVVLDFTAYVAHWSMHKLPFLWRFHRVHHSDSFVDVTTSFRQHPVEGLWRFMWTMVPALAIGLPAGGIVAYRLLSAINALFEHGNVNVPRGLDAFVSRAWVTPNVHKMHHSNVPRETNTNYGNLFSLFDRMFRTFTPGDCAAGVDYGLSDMQPNRKETPASLLQLPFERARPITAADAS